MVSRLELEIRPSEQDVDPDEWISDHEVYKEESGQSGGNPERYADVDPDEWISEHEVAVQR